MSNSYFSKESIELRVAAMAKTRPSELYCVQTARIEAYLTQTMDKAYECCTEQGLLSPSSQQCVDWAHGAFMAWLLITANYREEADYQRLNAIISQTSEGDF